MNRIAGAGLVILVGCAGNRLEAAPSDTPLVELAPVTEPLCVTRGTAKLGGTVRDPTMRAIAPNTDGDAASLGFVYRGKTGSTRKLAGGQARHQLGLKLRAQDGCNVVYVMWRLDPTPTLEVSVKRNVSANNHVGCGADGYFKVKRRGKQPAIPVLELGDEHTLRAEIRRDELTAWIDDTVVWRGALPTSARDLVGPAGVRSDNTSFDLVAFAARAGAPGQPLPRCTNEDPE